MLIHQPHGGAQGQSTDIEIQVREMVEMRDRMVEVLVKATGQTRERITADIDRDHILRGEAAVAYGLVDDVLESRDLRLVPGGGADRPLRRASCSGADLLALDLVEAAPDAVGLADADRVAEAGLADGAGGADGLGPVLALQLLVLALEVGRREEHLGLRPAARGLQLPGLVDTLCAHVASPFRRRPYRRVL